MKELDTSLFYNVKILMLKNSIREQSLNELVETYKSINLVLNLCLTFANMPAVTYPLSELAHAYWLEIVNRYLQPGGNPKNTR